jgi:hypothetical protein
METASATGTSHPPCADFVCLRASPSGRRSLAKPMTRGLALLLFIAACSATAFGQPNPSQNRLKVLRDIIVESGETAGDVQCFMCSVHVQGQVTGDIITLGGGIFVDGKVNGDVIGVGGRIEVNSNSRISGEAVALGGYITLQPNSSIGGNAESLPYLLIPGQYRPTFLGSLTLAIVNVFFVALGYLVVRDKRAETASLAIERQPGSVLFTGFVCVALFYGLDWLTRYLGSAEIFGAILLLVLLAAVAATGATGLGDWVARLAFPQTRGIWACIGGVLALSLLELVPLLGMLVFALGLIISIGASVVTRFGSREVSEPVHALN